MLDKNQQNLNQRLIKVDSRIFILKSLQNGSKTYGSNGYILIVGFEQISFLSFLSNLREVDTDLFGEEHPRRSSYFEIRSSLEKIAKFVQNLKFSFCVEILFKQMNAKIFETLLIEKFIVYIHAVATIVQMNSVVLALSQS